MQEAIVRGDLAAGARISEAELAARYGVSRGPLREALRRFDTTVEVDIGSPVHPNDYAHLTNRQELTNYFYQRVQQVGHSQTRNER